MRALSYILTAATILVLGVVCNAVYAHYNSGDGWAFLVNSFCYACALPALLVPYYVFLTRNLPLRSFGIMSALAVGIAFPVVIGGLTRLGYSVGMDMTWSKLVESPIGWIVLIAITLGPGVSLAYAAVKVEAMLCDQSLCNAFSVADLRPM